MFGATKAASVAIALYVLHNIFYAAFAFVAGWLADRFRKYLGLATGYALAAVMAIILLRCPRAPGCLELCSSLAAAMSASRRLWKIRCAQNSLTRRIIGMAFGVLATVNGIGDFLSSAIVGLLWSVAGTAVAFGYSAALFIAGAVLVARLSAQYPNHSRV